MDEIANSLASTVENGNFEKIDVELENIVAELSSIDIDELADSKVLEQIPVIKIVVVFAKVFKSVSNYFYVRKIVKFLFQLNNTSLKERQEFIQKLNTDEKKKIFENLALILDKYEHLQKAEIQGKLFKALIKNDITQEEYFKLNYATSMINIDDVDELIHYAKAGENYSIAPQLRFNFAFIQLVIIDTSQVGTYNGGITSYVSPLGKKYVSIITSQD